MSLSWNEIRSRATQFIHKWRDESREEAEAKSFWDDFFDVFGQKRRALAAFEAPVKKADGNYGFIDLFWEGVLLVEHKSRGKSLDKAYDQSLSYFAGLKDSQLPRYVLVSDFEHFRLYDVEEQTNTDFAFGELLSHLHLFGFMAGYTRVKLRDEDPANLQAAELLGRLHDELEKQGYVDKELELFMVRLLFCLFADDTGIFPKDSFTYYIENYSQEDGRNLGSVINEVFNILDSPEGRRQKTVDQDLGQFPYVNGDLFSATLRPPIFERAGRQALLACCYFDWSKISPAIFGSLFQSVMNPRERRSLGAHYTSEKNILKVINSLFMDDLRAEFERVKNNARQVVSFHQKLAGLNFLDPACGCGNFLIMAYRELRMLEIEVIKARYKWVSQARGGGRFNVQRTLDVADLSQLYVSQFYGIEIEEFAARIAEVAMWMVDHQMNLLLSETFGHYYRRLPLRHSPHIHHGDALALDWKKHIAPKALSYMMGNPPFVGSKLMEPKQREGLLAALPGVKGAGTLDFVSAWYAKAAQYIQGTDIRVALVSTNSITQGEQVGILWQYLLKMGVKIHFAHRTFKWTNEARGKAAVYCVIIGFGLQPAAQCYLFDYEDIKGEPEKRAVSRINPYLVDAEDTLVLKRTKPICKEMPEIKFGNQPIDGGGLIIKSEQELEGILKKSPELSIVIKRYMGSYEFINNTKRWCLWLDNDTAHTFRKSEALKERIKRVKEFRLNSKRKDTRLLAEAPSRFAFISHPQKEYLVIPSVSSETRKYIPMGFMSKEVIASNLVLLIPDATLYHFGILTSAMHMAWVRQVCGRLKSDYRYSNQIVYNNYPWPAQPGTKQQQAVEAAAQAVLDARAAYPGASLADLYDPLCMPKPLLDAHRRLDKAVDACYRPQPFATELARLQFLFELYRQYTEPLLKDLKPPKPTRGRKRKT